MQRREPPPQRPWRLRGLPGARVAGIAVPVAVTRRSRLLGLALLRRERAGAGLLIPRCRSVHTLGMRFRLDVVFLDARGRELSRRRAVRPGRVVADRAARAVLELPGDDSGESVNRPGAARPPSG